MHVKLYIHDKPLYLCDKIDEPLNRLIHQPDNVFIDELDARSVKAMLKEMNLPEIRSGIFYHEDLTKLKKAFYKKFEIIQAGGGLVTNELGEILMIFRRGYWDMPKGKLDKGETLEECALREVKEETGIKKLKLIKPLAVTYHTYEQGTHHLLKESHWFLMKTKSSEDLIAQREEDIMEIEWVIPEKIDDHLAHAYPSIVDVVELYLTKKPPLK